MAPERSHGCGAGNRPNILYLMTDQQKASASGVHVPTPFMAAMAARGTSFEQAYSTSPICTPSRASVFTGVHPLVHQVTCHQNRAPDNLPQLSELLDSQGYYTAAVGHYEHDRELTRGWQEQISMKENGPVGEALKLWYSHGDSDVGWSSGTLEYPPEEGHAHRLVSRSIEALDGIESTDAPYFLHLALLEAHPPYFASPPYDTLVRADKVTLPAQGGSGRPEWQIMAREQMGTEKATENDIVKMVAVYLGMLAYADAQMRRLCEEMGRRGLLENTWIIIGSDHGDYAGEKGLFTKTESLYECLLHVPLIIVPPANIQWNRGGRVAGLVDHVDLFPTILTLAGAPVPAYAQGHDLVSWLRGGLREPLRDAVFAQVGEYHGSLGTTMPSGLPLAGRHPGLVQGVRTAAFSYVRDPDYGDEAYDLLQDPQELVNLVGSGKRREPPEVADLRRRVDQWEVECLGLREELGVVPGLRGFGQ